MIQSVITFSPATGNLASYDECWRRESYEDRYNGLVSHIVANKGGKPQATLILFREGVFSIPEGTTMSSLCKIASEIHSVCEIDCFQISIDYATMTAHMLFDWYNYKELRPIHYHTTYQLHASVIVLRGLGLPLPDDFTPQWHRYTLLWHFRHNSRIFDDASNVLKHCPLGRQYYTFFSDLLSYGKNLSLSLAK